MIMQTRPTRDVAVFIMGELLEIPPAPPIIIIGGREGMKGGRKGIDGGIPNGGMGGRANGGGPGKFDREFGGSVCLLRK